MCSIPIIPINGYIVGTDDRIGAVVSFHCNPGYRLVGSPTMTCIAIPSPWKHSVMWDPEDDRQCQSKELYLKLENPRKYGAKGCVEHFCEPAVK